MNALTELILDLLFPPKCMLCGTVLRSRERTLCCGCAYEELPEYEGQPREVPYFEECVSPFFYKEPISGAVLRMKFHGMQTYVDQFASWMAVPVRDRLGGCYDIISWVPCSRRRIWSRGFDQAKLLALALARELDAEAVCTLKKIKHNPKQSKTPNAAVRRANVLGVYEAYRPEDFAEKRILLIDDVLTTGATLSECGKVLQMAGAGKLTCAVIAASDGKSDK